MRHLLLILLATLTGAPALAEIVGREVRYAGDGIEMHGFMAWDASREGPRPGVLVVHEWWGHDEYARKRALMLAEMGYTTLAVDMYGEGRQADHPDQAGAFVQEVTDRAEGMEARFRAALETLRKDPRTDVTRIAAIGYCFGGSVVLNMARAGVDLAGVASFHGGLDPIEEPARADTLHASIIVFNGADDPMVSVESIGAFKAEMEAADADYEFINYPGVLHSFTNPAADEYAELGLPLAYDADADRDSWERLEEFLQRTLD